MNNIIFEDGLSREKIENDIDGLGKFKWLLDIECENLVVGISSDQENLIIKGGTFISGTLF